MSDQPPKTVIISGGTTGMGRALALERLARGDHVTGIGSNEARGRALLGQAADPNLRFLRADLSSIAEVERVIDEGTPTGQQPGVFKPLYGLALVAHVRPLFPVPAPWGCRPRSDWIYGVSGQALAAPRGWE